MPHLPCAISLWQNPHRFWILSPKMDWIVACISFGFIPQFCATQKKTNTIQPIHCDTNWAKERERDRQVNKHMSDLKRWTKHTTTTKSASFLSSGFTLLCATVVCLTCCSKKNMHSECLCTPNNVRIHITNNCNHNKNHRSDNQTTVTTTR